MRRWSSSRCPEESRLVEFLEGLLDVPGSGEVEQHASTCKTCRQVLVAISCERPPTPRASDVSTDERMMTALARPLLDTGWILGQRYRIERLLALGGMGSVFVARHVMTEEQVALKVVRLDPTSREDMTRFHLEARVFAQAPCPHIVRVLDAGVDPALRLGYIAMELLAGDTLGAHVRKRGALSPASVVDLVRQVGVALDAVHLRGNRALPPIVHRDLKPDNVFLAGSPEAPHVKLLDFGLAKLAAEDAWVSLELRGSPPFMAPEQIEGKPVTPETDVFALGLLAFYALVGCSYWLGARGGLSTAALLRETLAGTRVPASERASALGRLAPPSSFDVWFARSTAAEPHDRFSSAGRAAEALALALAEKRACG